MKRRSKHWLRFLVAITAITALFLVSVRIYSGRCSQALCRSAIMAIQVYQLRLHPFTHPFVRCRLQPTCSSFAIQRFKSGKFEESLVAVAERLRECARTPVAAKPIQPEAPPAVFAAATLQRDDQGAAAGAACCASFGLIAVFIVLGLLALGIILLIWVARDAKSRGVDNPVLWLILVFFTGLIGFIIYLAVRPNGTLVPCEHCPNKKLEYAKMCPHCGQLDARVPASP